MFFENLSKACETEGLAVKEVMDDLGINYKTWYNWRAHGATPRKETIEEISDLLGIQPSQLLDKGVTLETIEHKEIVQKKMSEVRSYCNYEIKRQGQKKREEKIVETYLDDIREILLACNNRQRCEIMHFVYGYEDEVNKG